MNRWITTTFAAVAMLLGLSAFSPAMAGAAGGGQAGQKIKAALAQLDLTASQKQQIKQIMSDAKSSFKSSKGAGGAAAGGTGRAHSGAGKEIIQKILAVLTPEQKMKLRQILKAEKSTSATKT